MKNSYLLNMPIMTNDPMLKISDMKVVGDKMKLEVFARTNESLDDSTNIVELTKINGALYLQTSDKWGGGECVQDGREAASHARNLRAADKHDTHDLHERPSHVYGLQKQGLRHA